MEHENEKEKGKNQGKEKENKKKEKEKGKEQEHLLVTRPQAILLLTLPCIHNRCQEAGIPLIIMETLYSAVQCSIYSSTVYTPYSI